MRAQTSLFEEIIVDNFAGGGGASTGIELATGRPVNIAINHDPDAIRMHKTNHPYTEHLCESVWDVDPKEICRGRKIGLAWFSPDCKHFSKAKGGKPLDHNVRGLAWVALRWASLPEHLKPRIIILENVEEFKTWCPLIDGKPDPRNKGRTFRSFCNALRAHGYAVEHRELTAADYGAPTSRKRFFLIARSDGHPIVWPEATHGTGRGLRPYKTAADIIDWSIPCPSIFATADEIAQEYGIRAVRPLAENTMRRIARGIKKFVIDNPQPFVIQVNHGGAAFRGQRIVEPLQTITSKHGYGVVAPTLIQYHGEKHPGEVRGQETGKPILTVDAAPRYALVNAFIAKHYGGGYTGAGSAIHDPTPTVTATDHNALVAAYVTKFYGTGTGHKADKPMATVTTSPGHLAEVRALLIKYYGQGVGQPVDRPLDTITAQDRFGLVTIHGTDYAVVDIGMRMLTPRELYNAQGFPPDYIIDRDYTGQTYTKTKQVARCGNAVPPPFAEAITRANWPEACGGHITTMEKLQELTAG